jgi:Uma2 family endonuclease
VSRVDSTEDYDRGEKTRHYKQLSSVREILIVSHREPRLTLHRRDGTEWRTIDVRAHETVELAGIAVRLPVDDVYEQGLEDLSPASV